MTNALAVVIVLVCYAAALGAIFWGFFAGWFDPPPAPRVFSITVSDFVTIYPPVDAGIVITACGVVIKDVTVINKCTGAVVR